MNQEPDANVPEGEESSEENEEEESSKEDEGEESSEEDEGEEISKEENVMNVENKEPAGRRGACSFIYNDKFCLYSGYSGGIALNQRSTAKLEVLDLTSGCWVTEITKGEEEDLPQCLSGACCTVTNDCLYVFGGWLASERNADVHELNLSTLIWRKLPARNRGKGPMLKDKAGIVAYGKRMLCVFGGYGYLSWDHPTYGQSGATYHADLQYVQYGWEICWTNELHLFHIPTCEWISPVTTGVRPPPCAAFSFTKVDCSRVVLFGGRQQKERVNEVHILDMSNWHWSGAILQSRPEEPWPSKRSFHTACVLVDPDIVCSRTGPTLMCGGCQSTPSPDIKEWLPYPMPDLSHPDNGDGTSKRWCGDPKVLLMLGMDNKADPIIDAWIFNVNTLTWEQVPLPPNTPGRIWHTMSSHHPSPAEAEVVMFGGTSQNIFATQEPLLDNISQTTIMHCGVRSLYDLSCSFIISNWDFFLPLLSQLPLHVKKVLHCEQQRLKILQDNVHTMLRL